MPSVFLVSDTHFGHAGVCRFTREDGFTKLRPWTDPEEMDEAMVKLWNETVGKRDKVYMLGDIVINRKALSTLGRLNGDKVLIRGNHDIFKLEDYTKYFRDIRATHIMKGLIFTHIPIHHDSLARFGCNVHGHLHEKRVMLDDEIDNRYICVSVEHTDFKPISLEDLRDRIVAQGGELEMRGVSSWDDMQPKQVEKYFSTTVHFPNGSSTKVTTVAYSIADAEKFIRSRYDSSATIGELQLEAN